MIKMTTRTHPSAAERRRRVAALRALLAQRFGGVIVVLSEPVEPVDPLMVERLQRAIDAPRCRRSKICRNRKPGIA